MNKSDKTQIMVALIIWLLVFISAKYSKAETIYNFIFNPERTQHEQTINQSQNANQQIQTNSDTTKNIADTKSHSESSVGTTSVRRDVSGLLSPGMLRFSTYATAFSARQSVHEYADAWYYYDVNYYNTPRESGHKNKYMQDYGFSIALDLFPIKYFGLSSELTIGKEKELFRIGAASFSTKVVPLHFGLFSKENIFEIGGEFGYSTYKYHSGKVKKMLGDPFKKDDFYDYAESVSLESRFFYGGISRINLVKNVYMDLTLRRFVQFPIWQANAGLSYNF